MTNPIITEEQLTEIKENIRKFFGDNVEIQSGQRVDPCGDEEYIVKIITKKTIGDAWETLHQFDDEWWIDNLIPGVIVDVEYSKCVDV